MKQRKKTEKKKKPTARRRKPEKVAKGFSLFCKGESLTSIAKTLGLSRSTVARYRDRDNWEARRTEVNKKAMKKLDANVANEQSRQLALARFMQTKGVNRMRTLTDEEISAKDSITMVKEGILLERAIMGEGEKEIEIKIKLPAGLEDL